METGRKHYGRTLYPQSWRADGRRAHFAAEKKLLIAGCGGLGGYLSEYLLRLGVGKLVVADPERFDRSNLNRQLLCTEESIGRYKAETAAARAARVAPECRFEGHVCRLDENTLPELLRGCDAALDALSYAMEAVDQYGDAIYHVLLDGLDAEQVIEKLALEE